MSKKRGKPKNSRGHVEPRKPHPPQRVPERSVMVIDDPLAQYKEIVNSDIYMTEKPYCPECIHKKSLKLTPDLPYEVMGCFYDNYGLVLPRKQVQDNGHPEWCPRIDTVSWLCKRKLHGRLT